MQSQVIGGYSPVQSSNQNNNVNTSLDTITKKMRDARLNYIAEHKPYLLIVHAHGRYLGDFFGGFNIKTYVENVWGQDASHLYQYEHLKAKHEYFAYASEYESIIDKLPLTDYECLELVEESKIAFDFMLEAITLI